MLFDSLFRIALLTSLRSPHKAPLSFQRRITPENTTRKLSRLSLSFSHSQPPSAKAAKRGGTFPIGGQSSRTSCRLSERRGLPAPRCAVGRRRWPSPARRLGPAPGRWAACHALGAPCQRQHAQARPPLQPSAPPPGSREISAPGWGCA
jgi:hypothetical protein